MTGPHIDGSRVYRFDKAALLAWRHERLTFGEALALLDVSKATLDRWVRQGKLSPLEDMGGKQRWFARAEMEAAAKWVKALGSSLVRQRRVTSTGNWAHHSHFVPSCYRRGGAHL